MLSGPHVHRLVLIGFLALCYAVAGASAFVTTSAPEGWYPSLVKPAFNPPAWLFGPVWWTLFTLMAIAAWRVWRIHAGFERLSTPLTLFFVQLAFNLEWTVLFFGMQMIGWALFDAVLLFGLILITTYAFYQKDRTAGHLMLPYLAWVGFATVLNAAIWRLN